MITKWTIKYWDKDGTEDVLEAWFNQRDHNQFKAIAKELALLERCGNNLRLPHSKSLGQGLLELRERCYGYRIYYSFSTNKEIILLHAGDKSTQQKDIKVAYNRLSKLKKMRCTT